MQLKFIAVVAIVAGACGGSTNGQNPSGSGATGGDGSNPTGCRPGELGCSCLDEEPLCESVYKCRSDDGSVPEPGGGGTCLLPSECDATGGVKCLSSRVAEVCEDLTECNTTCARAQEYDLRKAVAESTVFAPLPADCPARPADGPWTASAAVADAPDVVLEIRNGQLASLNSFACENMAPEQTTDADSCAEIYQCGCCYIEFSIGLSMTGWGVRSAGFRDDEFMCEELRALGYDVGGPWNPDPPPPPPPDEPGCDLSGAPLCCLCYEECRICTSIRDIDCWRDCYSECRSCCNQCNF